MPTLGNVGASALVKSAASIASQLQDYQDKLMALSWNSSAQTDADFQEYKTYLTNRIDKLRSAGSLSTSSKALTLTTTLQSANRSYVSNSIQRASMAILDGSGTPVDKQNQIVEFYKQALSNGDESLAQNLLSQYYSLDQQIQYNAQVAAESGATLYKANAKAQAAGYADAASMIQDQLASLSAEYKGSGQATLTKAFKDFSKENASIFKALGIQLPEGSAVTNGAVIAGAIQAIAKANYLAADAVANTDASAYNNYISEGDSYIVNGTGTVSALGHSFTLDEAQAYANNPKMFVQKTTGQGVVGQNKDGSPKYGTTYGLEKAAILGYQYSPQGDIVPIYADSAENPLDKNGREDIQKDLEKAGFSVKIADDGTIYASQSSDGRNGFFSNAISQYGIDKNQQFIVNKTSSGYQFAPIDSANGNQLLLTVAKDTGGRYGVYNSSFDPLSQRAKNTLLGRFDNFDLINNTLSANDPGGLSAVLKRSFSNFGSQPQGFTENNIIPQIADQFFGGNKQAAAEAVYKYRKPLEQALASPKAPTSQVLKTGNILGVDNKKSIASNTTSILGVPTIGPKPVTLDAALKQAFTGFAGRYQGYTESTILPSIAKQFFNGDIKKAADVVYPYRKNNGFEGLKQAPAPTQQPYKSPISTSILGF